MSNAQPARVPGKGVDSFLNEHLTRFVSKFSILSLKKTCLRWLTTSSNTAKSFPKQKKNQMYGEERLYIVEIERTVYMFFFIWLVWICLELRYLQIQYSGMWIPWPLSGRLETTGSPKILTWRGQMSLAHCPNHVPKNAFPNYVPKMRSRIALPTCIPKLRAY